MRVRRRCASAAGSGILPRQLCCQRSSALAAMRPHELSGASCLPQVELMTAIDDPHSAGIPGFEPIARSRRRCGRNTAHQRPSVGEGPQRRHGATGGGEEGRVQAHRRCSEGHLGWVLRVTPGYSAGLCGSAALVTTCPANHRPLPRTKREHQEDDVGWHHCHRSVLNA